MKRLIAVVALTLLLSASVVANSVDNEAQTVANTMVSRFVDAWNHADGAAYGKNYWPEAELVDPVGRIKSGQLAIVEEHVDAGPGL